MHIAAALNLKVNQDAHQLTSPLLQLIVVLNIVFFVVVEQNGLTQQQC